MATAKYLRFSVDDGNTSDSESVSNQRDLLDWFISANEDLRSGEIIEFVDDGFTGTNFERGGFIAMMDAVKTRKIDCTLTREMVKELVKEVRVHSATELEIVWKFDECYHELEQGFMPDLNI